MPALPAASCARCPAGSGCRCGSTTRTSTSPSTCGARRCPRRAPRPCCASWSGGCWPASSTAPARCGRSTWSRAWPAAGSRSSPRPTTRWSTGWPRWTSARPCSTPPRSPRDDAARRLAPAPRAVRAGAGRGGGGGGPAPPAAGARPGRPGRPSDVRETVAAVGRAPCGRGVGRAAPRRRGPPGAAAQRRDRRAAPLRHGRARRWPTTGRCAGARRHRQRRDARGRRRRPAALADRARRAADRGRAVRALVPVSVRASAAGHRIATASRPTSSSCRWPSTAGLDQPVNCKDERTALSANVLGRKGRSLRLERAAAGKRSRVDQAPVAGNGD